MREGAKAVAAGMNPMDLKRGIEAAVEAVVKDLEKRTRKVTTDEEVAQVGTISANGDRVLFGKWSGTEVKLDGEDLLIMKESDIMGVLEGAASSKKKAA